jgi:hypothetical protein
MSAGCGRVGVLTGSASLPAGWPPATSRRKGSVMVSEELIRRWETVYGEYGRVSEMVNLAEPGNREVARQMALASGNVALAWRQMAAEPDMSWWSVAALSAAAQAFEYQARDWTARANYDEQSSTGGGRARRDAYPVATRRTGRHGQGGVADAV